ncbi:hypothetical protein EYF80_035646 [Liparis tanakae]|uniref:Uncharacterized protein n=1 Tax=Liparis tanakae TaxID=230148 RepID=A0A4Z2GKM1_9TELE|nr:hypothetical protein EYF80_035646 [Liparis tanakae]
MRTTLLTRANTSEAMLVSPRAQYLYDCSETGQGSRYSQANLIHQLCVHYCRIKSGIEMTEVGLWGQPQTHHPHHDAEDSKRTCGKKATAAGRSSSRGAEASEGGGSRLTLGNLDGAGADSTDHITQQSEEGDEGSHRQDGEQHAHSDEELEAFEPSAPEVLQVHDVCDERPERQHSCWKTS